MKPVRLRMVFEDASLLRGSQRRRGLQRCCFLLRPAISTIAELATHLHKTFGLRCSSPHEINISIDGFVLPPFESTCILKDEDLIMIKKNDAVLEDIKLFISQSPEQVLQSRQILALHNRNLAIINPQTDSQGEENDTIIRRRAHIETSNEKGKEFCKRKISYKLQDSNTLAKKDSQAVLQGASRKFLLKGASSSKMINATRKRKHFDKLLDTDNAIAVADSQGNSKGDEEVDDDFHRKIVYKKVAYNEIMDSKYKIQQSNKIDAKNKPATVSRGDVQVDEWDLRYSHKKPACKKTSFEIAETKIKENLSNKLQRSENYQGEASSSMSTDSAETPRENMNATKRKHLKNLQSSVNGDKENDGEHASKNDANVQVKKVLSRSARRKKAKRLWLRTTGIKKKKMVTKILTREAEEKDNTPENENADQSNAVDEEIAPVIIHPDHVHIESYDECGMQENESLMDDFVLQTFESTCILKDDGMVMDSRGDLAKDEENSDAYVNIAPKEGQSNEMGTKKHSKKLQISDSKADLQVDNGKFGPPYPHKEASSSEMTNANNKRKHLDKFLDSDNTMVVEDSLGNSKRDEEGDDDLQKTTSDEMLTPKYNRTIDNILTNITLETKISRGDSHGDKGDLGPFCRTPACKKTAEIEKGKSEGKQFNKLQSSENRDTESDGEYESKNDDNINVKKVQSRNSRRKKAKRKFSRTHDKEKIKKMTEVQILEGDKMYSSPSENENIEQCNVVDEEIIPVIVRPGHIRFESSDDMCGMKVDKPMLPFQETLQWNGTTSKKKGQKWGRESNFNQWDDDKSNSFLYGEFSNSKETELLVEAPNENSSIIEDEPYDDEPNSYQMEPIEDCSENHSPKAYEELKEAIDFASLLPLVHFPQEGDVLAYRMVELSSSWCPELSSFRVGKVSSYDSSSLKIILLPLPEYPIFSEEMISEELPEICSLYKEDGTLEIDFTSLVDVRLFKARDSESPIPSTIPGEEVPNSDFYSSNMETSSNCTEGWELINQALMEKKAQLQKQNYMDTINTCIKTTKGEPWSYRALRRNAIGPILAMLRSSNDDDSK